MGRHSMHLPPPFRVQPGQIWADPRNRKVLTLRTDRGYVIVLNEFGTNESYAISKVSRDHTFHEFKFVKVYKHKNDFPSMFGPLDTSK